MGSTTKKTRRYADGNRRRPYQKTLLRCHCCNNIFELKSINGPAKYCPPCRPLAKQQKRKEHNNKQQKRGLLT